MRCRTKSGTVPPRMAWCRAARTGRCVAGQIGAAAMAVVSGKWAAWGDPLLYTAFCDGVALHRGAKGGQRTEGAHGEMGSTTSFSPSRRAPFITSQTAPPPGRPCVMCPQASRDRAAAWRGPRSERQPHPAKPVHKQAVQHRDAVQLNKRAAGAQRTAAARRTGDRCVPVGPGGVLLLRMYDTSTLLSRTHARAMRHVPFAGNYR